MIPEQIDQISILCSYDDFGIREVCGRGRLLGIRNGGRGEYRGGFVRFGRVSVSSCRLVGTIISMSILPNINKTN